MENPSEKVMSYFKLTATFDGKKFDFGDFENDDYTYMFI